jgi:hypothetical protein
MTVLGQSASMMLLPQEIIDHIITKLDDPRHLGSCALVSRAFCPQAQRLLFSHVILDDDYPYKLTDLAHILAQNPTLASYVRSAHLLLDCRAGRSREGTIGGGSGPAQAAHDIESILRACRIEELEVHRTELTSASKRVLSSENLPYLKRFCVMHVFMGATAAMHDLLSAFPPLDQLELDLGHFAIYDRTMSLKHRPVHVKRLHINTLIVCTLPHRHLSDVCTGLKELKLILQFKDAQVAEPVNDLLKSWDAELDCFHVHIKSHNGLLRKSPHLPAQQVPR